MMYLVLLVAIISIIFAFTEKENNKLRKLAFGIAFVTQCMVLLWIY
jgi:hypothetical protein